MSSLARFTAEVSLRTGPTCRTHACTPSSISIISHSANQIRALEATQCFSLSSETTFDGGRHLPCTATPRWGWSGVEEVRVPYVCAKSLKKIYKMQRADAMMPLHMRIPSPDGIFGKDTGPEGRTPSPFHKLPHLRALLSPSGVQLRQRKGFPARYIGFFRPSLVQRIRRVDADCRRSQVIGRHARRHRNGRIAAAAR